jgi:hypothetical protein
MQNIFLPFSSWSIFMIESKRRINGKMCACFWRAKLNFEGWQSWTRGKLNFIRNLKLRSFSKNRIFLLKNKN